MNNKSQSREAVSALELTGGRDSSWKIALRCFAVFLGSSNEPRQQLLLIYGATSVGMVAFHASALPQCLALGAYLAALHYRRPQKRRS